MPDMGQYLALMLANAANSYFRNKALSNAAALKTKKEQQKQFYDTNFKIMMDKNLSREDRLKARDNLRSVFGDAIPELSLDSVEKIGATKTTTGTTGTRKTTKTAGYEPLITPPQQMVRPILPEALTPEGQALKQEIGAVTAGRRGYSKLDRYIEDKLDQGIDVTINGDIVEMPKYDTGRVQALQQQLAEREQEPLRTGEGVIVPQRALTPEESAMNEIVRRKMPEWEANRYLEMRGLKGIEKKATPRAKTGLSDTNKRYYNDISHTIGLYDKFFKEDELDSKQTEDLMFMRGLLNKLNEGMNITRKEKNRYDKIASGFVEPPKEPQPDIKETANKYFQSLQQGGIDPDTARKMVRDKFGI